MPGAVMQAGLTHKVLPLAAIASEILRIASCAAAADPASTVGPTTVFGRRLA
jgi:hypothetical protein